MADHTVRTGPRIAGAVGDAVVHRAKVGEIEQVAHQAAALGTELALDMIVLGHREVHRQGLAAGTDLERHLVVFISSRNCSR